jgi:hypothetical protein
MTSYRLHGITDDTDTCEICGKVELRRVVMLAALDADGNTEEIVYAGTTCAARALSKRGVRTTAAKVRDAAAAAARVADRAREFAAEFAPITLNEYIAANHVGLMNATNGDVTAALAKARTDYAGLQREIGLIRSGALTGTRFEASLPTL